MALATSPEERFALDVYSDPTLTVDEKLARLQAYSAGAANDPTAPPVNDNGLPAIPAGPPIDPMATAQIDPRAAAAMGAEANRPPIESPEHQRSVPDVTQLPKTPPGPEFLQAQALAAREAQLQDDLRRGRVLESEYPARKAALDAEKAKQAVIIQTPGEQTAPTLGDVDPSQVQFGAPAMAEQPAPPRPQFATVGTDTFQPVQRTTRGAVDLAEYEQGEAGPVEFGVSGFETETVIDPATGKPIKRKVAAGLNVAPGEPGEIRRKPLEPQFQEAEGAEEQAVLDQRAGREYADDAVLRQAVAVEDKIRGIEEDRVRRENERLNRIAEKQKKFEAVLTETSNPENPVDAYWAKMDTGEHIIKGLALFFGTLGSAKTGTENVALKMIDSALQAEVETQRDSRRQKIEGARTLYDMTGDIFESEAARDAATYEAAYQRVQREAQRFQTFAQTPERRAQFDQLLAQLEQKRLAAQAQRISAMEGEVSLTERFDPKRTVAIGGGKDKDEYRKRRIILPDGSEAYVRDAGARKDTQEGIKVNASVARQAERIRRLRQQPGAKTDPKVRGEIEGAAADLFLALKQGAALGTLDKGSLEFRDEWVGKPLDLIDFGGADAKLNEISRAAQNRNRDAQRYDLDRNPEHHSPVIGDDAPAGAVRGAAK